MCEYDSPLLIHSAAANLFRCFSEEFRRFTINDLDLRIILVFDTSLDVIFGALFF